MQRHPTTDTVVYFTPDEVAQMLIEKLRAEGETRQVVSVQICVEQPFGDGMRVHNEVPRINVILDDVGM